MARHTSPKVTQRGRLHNVFVFCYIDHGCVCVTACDSHRDHVWLYGFKCGGSVNVVHTETVFHVLMKLDHGFLLLLCLDWPWSKCSDFFDGFQTWNVPGFHQITGQHGPRPAVTVHTVNRNTLKRRMDQNQVECVRQKTRHFGMLFLWWEYGLLISNNVN